MKSTNSKPLVTVITDRAESAALLAGGRWKEGKPLTWQEGETVYAETEPLKALRAARAQQSEGDHE